MASLIIQENGSTRTTPARHGEEITIQTPCDCSAVSGVQIAGVVYPFYDAAGKVLPMGKGLFSANALIRVLIDTVNTRATIINHAVTPEVIGAAKTDLSNVPESVLANLGGAKVVTGSFTVTPKSGVAETYTLTHNLGVKPKLIVIGNADSTAYRSLTLIDGNGNYSNSFGKLFCYGVNFYATTNPPQAGVTVSENDIIFSYKCEQSSYAKTTTVQYTLIY